jgi:hypothetical protein
MIRASRARMTLDEYESTSPCMWPAFTATVRPSTMSSHAVTSPSPPEPSGNSFL